MSLQVRLLGGFELERDGKLLCGLPTRKSQALLAYLIYCRHRPHSREALVGRFWPFVGQAKAQGNLRQALYQIRKKLGPEALVAEGTGVQLNPNFDCTCDVHAFSLLLEKAELAAAHEKAQLLEEAVALYRGPLLEGCCEDWAVSEAERLRDHHANALAQLVVCHKRFGRYDQALEHAHRAVELVPLREELHRELMELYAALGQRSAALRQYETCVKLLVEELGVEPQAQTVELYERICSGAPLELERSVPHNLPRQRASFVGRERELHEVRELLGRSCLLTLTGVGGVGKTRLALQAAYEEMHSFPDGVWWVDLSVLEDPALIPREIGAAMGLREQPGPARLESLAAALRERRVLLVLDNCERLVDEAATVAGFLQRDCLDMRILATSREVLRAEGEMVYAVPPMAVGRVRGELSNALPENQKAPEAVRLFVERAQASDPSFGLHRRNEGQVEEICRRLDGLPLAIELAAARVRSLSVEQITARLDDRFRLLTGGRRTALPRHQTLQAALDWSYELLSGTEQALLRRLTVFWGGWTLPAAKAVCVGGQLAEGDIRDCLAGLVDKSMVLFERGTAPRYRILDSVWYYAAERLAKSGNDEGEQSRARHLRFFLRLAEGTADAFRKALSHGSTGPSWLEEWGLELDNFRGAMRWALDHDRANAAMRIATGLEPFWHHRARVQEALAWISQGLRMKDSLSAATLGRARVVQGHALAQHGATDAETEAGVREGLDLCQESGDMFHAGLAWRALGLLASNRGEIDGGHASFSASLEVFLGKGDTLFAAYVRADLGEVCAAQGAFAEARRHMEESARLLRGYRGPAHRNAVLCLARLAFAEGDLEAAEAHIAEAIRLGVPEERTPAMARILITCGEIACKKEDLASAEQAVKKALELAGSFNLHLTKAKALHVLARLAIARADHPAARAHIDAALGILSQQRSVRDLPALLETSAQLVLGERDPRRAAELLGAAERLRETGHVPRAPVYDMQYQGLAASACGALGDRAFEAHWGQGRRLGAEEAIERVGAGDRLSSRQASPLGRRDGE